MQSKSYFLLFWLACAVPVAAHAGVVDVSVGNGQEMITVLAPDISPHKVFTVDKPDRLVIDVPSIGGHPGVALPGSYDGVLIKKLRYGRFNARTSRFVFDLNQPVHVVNVHEQNAREGDLLRITIAAAETGKHGKNTGRYVARTHRRPVIVIDPGHGGIDPGTIGTDGTEEKNVVLRIAKALQERLLATGRYEVRLTRDDDTFIMLRQRVEIARADHADMFISLHADSSPDPESSGLSVYTVSEKASDAEAAALAARENKSDVLAGVDLSDERQDVAGILISLAERDTNNRSATLADDLVTSLDGRVQLLQNSHRFAGFAVLKAPDIPSVLIETGFLSNPRGEKLLNSKAYCDKVVSGIVRGINAYFRQQRKNII